MEDAELVGPEGLAVAAASNGTSYHVACECCCHLHYFRRISRDTNLVSGDEEWLPSFEVVNCRLNLFAKCFGEDN